MARETKGSGDTGFPVLDSRTSGPHVCSRDVSKDCVGQSWRFLLPLKISLCQQPIKKIQINSKTLCPQSPSFLVARPQSAKRSEKGYGDENERNPASFPVVLVGRIRYRARFQASSAHLHCANWPGVEAALNHVTIILIPPQCFRIVNSYCTLRTLAGI